MISTYSINRQSQTMSNLLVGISMIAGAPAHAAVPVHVPAATRVTTPLQSQETPPSVTVTYDLEKPALAFEDGVGQVFSRLQAAQEPLGREFEQVLIDNLWNLYSRS
ncbi:hypothetical protein ACFPOE_11260 [Caenimonas terrae]|uniref:Uncharacterized protein n=1 Tax=Caenimonas terrae TaxID=696074 RepID=A0ABW0NGR8_9BURK